MRIILLLVAISTFQLFAQRDSVFISYDPIPGDDDYIKVTDTVLTMDGRENVLVGTCILPWTHGQLSGYSYGIRFSKVSKSNCKSSGPEVYRAKDKINSIYVTDSSITIDLTIYDNCCYEFLCDYEVDSAGIINIIYHGYGLYCACDCCFGLIYELSREKPFDDYPYDELNGVIINGDQETLMHIK